MDRYLFTCKWHHWRIMFQLHSLSLLRFMDVHAWKGSHPAVGTFFKSHVNNGPLICYRSIFFPLSSFQAYMLQLIVDYYYIVTNTGSHQVAIGRSTRVDYVWNNTMWHINLLSELASLGVISYGIHVLYRPPWMLFHFLFSVIHVTSLQSRLSFTQLRILTHSFFRLPSYVQNI